MALKRWGLAFTGAAILLAAAAWADDENEPKPEYGTPHPECTLFTERREHFLRGGIDGELLSPGGRHAFSRLTEEVVNALPPSGASPTRSRSSSLRGTASENYIDTHVFTQLRRLGIQPAAASTDEEFLRRVYLDLTGRIPTAEQAVQFLSDTRPDKRAILIDELLESPVWADRWAMFLGDLYRNTINTPNLNRLQQGRDAFHYYILDSLRENKSYKDMAWELIEAQGNSFEAGQVNFILSGRTTGGPIQDNYDSQAAIVATTFLGVAHLDCILCHDGAAHLDSLSVWGSQAKRLDAYGMAAFFSRTDLVAPNGNPLRAGSLTDSTAANLSYALNTNSGNRPTRRAIDGRTTVTPKYMLGSGGTPDRGENGRSALARFVTEDFQFARATANYIWREFLVAALVDPVDQFDPMRLDPNRPPPAPWTLQPSNPQLLEALAKSFVENNFNLKQLMREIANSRAYQLSARYEGTWNPSWERNYARKLVRRLRAEEIHDAVIVSSGLPGGYVLNGFREPRVDFAMQFPDVVGLPGDGNVQAFLNSFQRGNRYDDDRRSEITILQALNLMNNAFVYNRTRNTNGSLVNRVMAQSNEQLADTLFVTVLSRFPTRSEREAALAALSSGARANKVEDLLWSLYNKVDFIFNY